MKIKQIQLHELLDFVESGEYKKSDVIPITKYRAISQVRNPRANSDDVVLIIAYNDAGEIIAWVGALPDKIQGKTKVAWNTGWFADEKEGRKIALPLFLQFVKNYDYKVIFQDLTPHTTKILKALPGFKFVSEKVGIRVFLRFYFAEILVNRYPYLKIIQWIFLLGDFTGNIFQNLRIKRWLKRQHTGISLEVQETIDQEVQNFIENHNKNEVFRRNKKEFDWIFNNKWLEEAGKSSDIYKDRYHFSFEAKVFRYYLLKFRKGEELIGFILLKQRNGLADTPYVYLNKNYKQEIATELLKFIYDLNINSFVTFNKALLETISKHKCPKLHQKKLKRDIVIGKNLISELNEDMILQDGDGDVVFT